MLPGWTVGFLVVCALLVLSLFVVAGSHHGRMVTKAFRKAAQITGLTLSKRTKLVGQVRGFDVSVALAQSDQQAGNIRVAGARLREKTWFKDLSLDRSAQRKYGAEWSPSVIPQDDDDRLAFTLLSVPAIRNFLSTASDEARGVAVRDGELRVSSLVGTDGGHIARLVETAVGFAEMLADLPDRTVVLLNATKTETPDRQIACLRILLEEAPRGAESRRAAEHALQVRDSSQRLAAARVVLREQEVPVDLRLEALDVLASESVPQVSVPILNDLVKEGGEVGVRARKELERYEGGSLSMAASLEGEGQLSVTNQGELSTPAREDEQHAAEDQAASEVEHLGS